jgi:hypothetical protein
LAFSLQTFLHKRNRREKMPVFLRKSLQYTQF